MLQGQDYELQLSLSSTATMKDTADSDIFIMNLEVTALKILIKRDYFIICLFLKAVCKKKKKERKRYWVTVYLWMKST